MKIPRPVVIDFETFGIEGRPKYPPVPVGVSIKYPGKKSRYYAWGHPTENNCTWDEAAQALRSAWHVGGGLLFQNGKFDVDVAEVHFNLPRLDWSFYHDTLYLLFLDDPHQIELGLKPSAQRLLGILPEEQDAVGNWLIEHQPIPGAKISRSRNSKHYFGKYIAYAPGGLVGKYANGDVDRTEDLFKLLWPKTITRGMRAAYDRERQLMPILLEMERQGVPVDHIRLRDDVKKYNTWRTTINAWIIKHLKASSDINLDSGAELMAAMIKAGRVDEEKLEYTEKGKPRTNKETLLNAVTDKVLLAVLKYRTQLNTCLNTFMEPWLLVAEQSGGRIFTTWNQTKSTDGAGAVGTRTGRLSSTPNFQNIPKEFMPIFLHENPKDKSLPKCPFKDLPSLPLVRSYVVAWTKDHVLLDRDYSQQELKILGHFEDGALLDAYRANPWLDVHDHARDLINGMTGRNFDRKPIKNTGFGLIYGMGVGTLAMKSDVTVDVAKEVKDAYLEIFPGLKAMYKDMKVKSRSEQPFRTWGGREIYCEPSKMIDGRLVRFDYKMLNMLIQGSAADCTKAAVIRFHNTLKNSPLKKHVYLILTVHDEILISADKRYAVAAMDMLRTSMESVEFDVKMLSEGSWSKKSWADLDDYDKKGVKICKTL